MKTSRLEAFSDGVIAVIITIMVLELHTPENGTFAAFVTSLPSLLIYALSFVITAIFWNNHHHVLATAEHPTPRIMWTNMFMLFWISLIPFATSWVAHDLGASWPAACYGAILLLSGFFMQRLQRAIIASTGEQSLLKKAIGNDVKGKISLALYALGIIASFWYAWIAYAIYIVVIFSWFMPDSRIELSAKEE